MSATYTDTLPTARDRVRFVLGDTNVDPDANALIQDETYDALLTANGETMATIVAAESLSAQFGQKPGAVTLPSGLIVSWSDRVKTWLELAARLRKSLSDAQAQAAASTSNTYTAVQSVRWDAPDLGEYRRPDADGWGWGW